MDHHSKDVTRLFEIEYSTYHILNRSELCECSLMAGNYLLSQTDTNCGDMPDSRDGYFTTYYPLTRSYWTSSLPNLTYK